MPLAVLILGRDVLLGLVALYYRYISLPAPKTLARYWDFSLPSAEVRPTGISKVNTALQLGLIGWTMSGMAVGGDVGMWGEEGALRAMWYVDRTLFVGLVDRFDAMSKILIFFHCLVSLCPSALWASLPDYSHQLTRRQQSAGIWLAPQPFGAEQATSIPKTQSRSSRLETVHRGLGRRPKM